MLRQDSPPETGPLYRPTARVLVLDAQDRLPQLCAEDPRIDIAVLWHTPGGALLEGESYEQAAARELWEETGIVAPLGPCVWRRRHVFRVGDGHFDVDERYFVARVGSVGVEFDNHDPYERGTLTGHRWWSLDELSRTTETFVPRQLAELLPPVIARPYPTEPVRLDG